MTALRAADVISLLGLQPHPEGGHFRETFRDQAAAGSACAASAAIYFLLQAGEVSRWHRIERRGSLALVRRRRVRAGDQ